MDVFNLIIGVVIGFIFGMFINKLRVLIYVLLSCITSFGFVKLFHPSLYILPIYQWSWQNLFDESWYPYESMIGFFISIVLFHYVIKLFINKVIGRIIKIRYEKSIYHMSQKNRNGIKSYIYGVCKWTCAKIVLIEISPKKKSYSIESYISHAEYKGDILSFISISVHSCVAYLLLFSFDSMFIVMFVILIGLNTIAIIYDPMVKDYFNCLNKYVTHLYNRSIN